MKAVFLRVLEELNDKQSALHAVIANRCIPSGGRRFIVETETFTSVPRSPFAYWVSDGMRRLFQNLPPLEADGRNVCSGPDTGQDFRCIRIWWECRQPHPRWELHPKGGAFSPFYSDVLLLLLWGSSGHDLLSISSANIRNAEQYFRAGLTWPLRTKSELSVRAMAAKCIFGHKGPAILVEDDNEEKLLSLLAICNSKVFRSLIEFQLAAADARAGGAAHSYEVGVLQRTPLPFLGATEETRIADLGRQAWCLKRSLDTWIETSHAFTLPSLLQVEGETMGLRAKSWFERISSIESTLDAVQQRIDNLCFELYGIQESDRDSILDGCGRLSEANRPATVDEERDNEAESDEDSDTEASVDAANLAMGLISWIIGVAFGRFDVRLATGARPLPLAPQPFEPLALCSPGMLTGDDGLPLADPPIGYPFRFPKDGILVDDPGHPRDLTAGVRGLFKEIFGDRADDWWGQIGALLTPENHDLRTWLNSNFFEYHLKRHWKSRRKAPILWQLAVPSREYSIWLYAHRIGNDTFFQLQSEVADRKLPHEERQLADLIREAGPNPAAIQRKKIAAQETLVEELRAMLAEIKRVAPLWNPNLDDGIVLTMAPLWRLIPQHKAWQKELKSKWDELVAGQYDWAHVAMHLWPERVVTKCATDRSLAIAHGLEEVFWRKDQDDKWQPWPVPTRPVDELVHERTSPAVKAALKALLEAPGAAAPARRRGRNGKGAPA